MNLATATPVEIDTKLADLYLASDRAETAKQSAATAAHYALDERAQYVTRTRKEWPTTDDQAIAKARTIANPNGTATSTGTRAHRAVTAYDTATADLTRLEAEMAPLHTEYTRRPWSRFFLVEDGHYHSSMSCQTCNKNGQRTRFGWNPEMSGLSETDALAELGRRAAILCSVCFPNAPVEMYTKPANPNECGGSRKAPVEGTARRIGPYNTYAQCTGECGELQVITAAGTTRKHNKPKTK